MVTPEGAVHTTVWVSLGSTDPDLVRILGGAARHT